MIRIALIFLLSIAFMIASSLVSVGQLVVVAQTANVSHELDTADPKAAFIVNHLLEYLAKHDQSLTVEKGKKVRVGKYTHTPTKRDMMRLKKTLKISEGECSIIQNIKACAKANTIILTPLDSRNSGVGR